MYTLSLLLTQRPTKLFSLEIHCIDVSAKKSWNRAGEMRWLSIRSLLLPWSIFFLSIVTFQRSYQKHVNIATPTLQLDKVKKKGGNSFLIPAKESKAKPSKKGEKQTVLVTIYQPKLGSKDKAGSNKWFVAPW